MAKKTNKKSAKKKSTTGRTGKKAGSKKAAGKKKVKQAAKKVAKKVGKKVAKKGATQPAVKPAPSATTKKTAPAGKLMGRTIKDYELPITDGSAKKLSELSGPRGLVIYFYPKDSTPGCTVEACEFRDNLARVKATGYHPVGLSADSVSAHQKFTASQSLNFPLISDEQKILLGDLGLWVEKKLYGRSFMGIPRTTIVLDRDRTVQRVYENVKPKGHVDQILADLKG